MAMDIEFDAKEMRKFADQLAQAGDKVVRRELGKFLKQEAEKQMEIVAMNTFERVPYRTGNYWSGLKIGKRYNLRDGGTYAQRVYAGKPAYHAGLVEFGHKMSGWAARGGKTRQFEGKKVFSDAHDEFQPTFEQDAEEWVTTLLTDKLN